MNSLAPNDEREVDFERMNLSMFLAAWAVLFFHTTGGFAWAPTMRTIGRVPLRTSVHHQRMCVHTVHAL